jgi:hypothetical protein
MKKKIVIIIFIFIIGLGMAFLSGLAGSWHTQSISIVMDKTPTTIRSSSGQVKPAMGRLPLYFIQNRGQADPRARFTLRGGGQTVYLTDSGLLFDFLHCEKPDQDNRRASPVPLKGRRLVVGLDFAGANPQPEVSGAVEKATRFNYLIGNDRSKWVTAVPAYGEVVYRDLYPAIDMRLYDDGGTLRYDFIVRPGGKVADIRLAMRGIDGLRLDQGELVADTEFGEIRQSRPVVYQEGESGREIVEGSFAIEEQRRYAFRVGAYDPARPLVIDPQVLTLGYSTFLGGGSFDEANDIVWEGGYYFVTGDTMSALFPVSAGAYDTTLDNVDAFVAKIDPAASGTASLVWCTFVGGNSLDEARGIDVYGDEAYIAGITFSSDFPMANPGTLIYNDASDIFVTRLNNSGTALITSVCLGHPPGATVYEEANDISVSTPNAVWICGRTDAGPSLYPAVIGRSNHGAMGSPSAAADAFMIQVVTGATPATLGEVMTFGGQAFDEAVSIAQDGTNIYLTGNTNSDEFPTTAGAYQTSRQGGVDAFVFKSDFGGTMVYSTFLGTTSNDTGKGVDIGYGGAYVCGYTMGSFPSMPNGFDTTRTHNSSYNSGFLVRVNDTAGGSLDYGTYIETDDWGQNTRAFNLRTGGTSRTDCWVTGNTSYGMTGTSGTPSKNYYQLRQSIQDAFVARYDTAASGWDSCLFVTNLGGGNNDEGHGVDGYLGTVVVAGWTESAGFPVSASAYDASHNGDADVFVTTLNEPLLAATSNAATDIYSTSATLNASLTSKSSAISVYLQFQYSTTSGGPYSDMSTDAYNGTVPYAYSRSLTGLSANTTYYFRIRASSPLYADAYGSELSFATPAAAAPTVTTTAASSITTTSANSGGNVSAMGSDPVTARGVCWNTTGTPTTADSTTSNGSGTGTFTSSLSSLTPGTLYYVRAYATNISGTAYGNEVTFTTLQLPTVTTQAVNSITDSAAIGHGNITDLGIPNPTAHGVCWNTSGTPTLADGSSNRGAASSTGSFNTVIAGLSAYTTYYVRAFATNSAGTAYGNEVSFTTLGVVPTVTTQAVTAITATTATGNGNITILGVPNPTAHGVCWNTAGTPTIADNASNQGAAGSTGAFTAAISGLTAGTTYYVRAYATNIADTAYGNQVSFSTVPPAPVATAATSIGATGFSANWNASTSATGYRLDVSLSNTFASFVSGYNNLDVGNVTTYAVTGLAGGTTYYYRLRAYNASGTSADSNTITVLTVAAAPVATAATSIGATGFSANWTAATGAAGYRLDVSLSNTFASFIIGYNDLDVGNVTTYAVTGLSGSTAYYYRLRAYNASGTSVDSNTITVLTVPPAPVANAATNITGHSFQANWQAVGGATGYRIDVATDNAFTAILPAYNDLDAGNVLSLVAGGLAPNTPYYYRVRASNASGSSANSNVISLTTLQVHTVTFTCSAGGWLAGTLTQTVDHGSDSSPVTANAYDGYHFDGWSGSGGFSSPANPLTVTNVLADMTISGGFSNLPPTIRIINPVHNATVWGLVNIQAEVSDDLAVRSVEFFVDDAPPATAGMRGIPAGEKAPDSRLQMESGELYLDFNGADILLIDSQYRLRKASFQGELQTVIGRDLPLRDLALSGSKQVHLLFAEPLRLGDGNSYSWILCDLEAGSIRGIAGAPIHLPFSAKATAVQFDEAGNAYYFTAADTGSMVLCRRSANKTAAADAEKVEAIYTVTGQQVRDWLTLPDGMVLLSLFDPKTSQPAYLKVAGNDQRAASFEGGFAALLESAAGKRMDKPSAVNFLKVSHNRLLVSGTNALARSEWPARQWDRFSTDRVEVADTAADSDGNLFVTGRDMLSGRFGLWRVGHSGCEFLACTPTPCFRIAVLASPADDSPVYERTDTIPAKAVAANATCHSCDWDTLHCACGSHKISAVATDEAGAQARHEILVNVGNVMLSLSCQRFQDHGWLIKKNYIKVQLSVSNSAGAPVSKYVVYRRIGSGGEEIAREFLANEVQNGLCEFIEAAASGNPSTAYRAVALTADGMIIGASAHVSI